MALRDLLRQRAEKERPGNGKERKNKKKKSFVEFEGLRLPNRRSNFGLNSEEAYIKSATDQIERIRPYISSGSRILDFGSGQGRLLNGLVHLGVDIGHYVGADIDARSVAWCVGNLGYPGKNVTFVWYNYKHERYNTEGHGKLDLAVPDNYFDLVFSNSVFSHLADADTDQYAAVLFEKLKPGGVAYLTAFLESDVEPVSENPEGYHPGGTNTGTALLRVRYEKDYFMEKFVRAGFKLQAFTYQGVERSQQSEVILSKPAP
jgi:SAM-dependent methyltransferase